MKKIVATFCLLSATLALPACQSMNNDASPVYEAPRTAGYGGEAATPNRVAPAEKVFRRAQTK